MTDLKNTSDINIPDELKAASEEMFEEMKMMPADKSEMAEFIEKAQEAQSVIQVPEVEPMVLPKGAFTFAKKPVKDMDAYRKKRNKRNKAAKKSRRINRK
jgi:hypothetical protein